MTSPPDWAISIPSVPVHTEPATSGGWESLSQDQLRGLRENLLRSFLSVVIQSVQGLFIPGNLTDVIGQLTDWASNIPFIGPLVEAITGIIGGGLSDITDWFSGFLDGSNGGLLSQLVEAFTGLGGGLSDIIDWVGNLPLIGPLVEAITGIIDGDLSDIGSFFSTLLDGLWSAFTGDGTTGNPLTDIIGAITNGIGDLVSRAVGWLPGLGGIGQMGQTPINLLQNPGFDSSVSLSGEGVWTWDDTQDHTGTTGSGSAKVTADGGVKELLSNLINVEQGQVLDGSGWVRWSGMSATGYPIEVGLVCYLNGAIVATPYFDRIAAETGTSGWVELSGSYTVPAGIDTVRYVCKVNTTATAGTIWFDDLFLSKSGLLQQGFVANLLDDLGDLVPIPIFNDLLDTLGDTIGATLDDVIDRLTGFLTGSSPLNGGNIFGEILDDFLPGVKTTINNIVEGLMGLFGVDWGHDDAANALVATSNTITGNSAAIAQLQTVFTGGVSTGDDFERSSWGAGWSLVYSSGPGSWELDGHNAYWDPDLLSMDERTCRARYIGTNATSSTDYQTSTIILGSAAEKPLVGTSGCNDIILRADSGFTNYVRARWKADDTITISRFVSGVETVMNSGSVSNPGNGAALTFQAGKPGTARYFVAKVNTQTVLEITEAGTASMLGASYRGWGMGCRAGSNTLGITQSKPGKVKQWTAQDLL